MKKPSKNHYKGGDYMRAKKLWAHQAYAIEHYKDRPYFGLLFD